MTKDAGFQRLIGVLLLTFGITLQFGIPAGIAILGTALLLDGLIVALVNGLGNNEID